MICGFCGREIPERTPDPGTGCGSCSGGCRKVHCPYCGYANPAVPGLLKKLVRPKPDRDKE